MFSPFSLIGAFLGLFLIAILFAIYLAINLKYCRPPKISVIVRESENKEYEFIRMETMCRSFIQYPIISRNGIAWMKMLYIDPRLRSISISRNKDINFSDGFKLDDQIRFDFSQSIDIEKVKKTLKHDLFARHSPDDNAEEMIQKLFYSRILSLTKAESAKWTSAEFEKYRTEFFSDLGSTIQKSLLDDYGLDLVYLYYDHKETEQPVET